MSELLSRELRRKAFHVAGSLIPAGYYFVSREIAVIVLSSANVLFLLFEWLRLQRKIKFPEILQTLLRQHERESVAGYIYFQMAALLSILIFDKTVAIAALLMLSIGDTASGLAGAVMRGGDVRYNEKNTVKHPAIIAVMFAACMGIGLFLSSLPPAPDMKYLSLWAYFAGALGAAVGDSVPIKIMGKSIDDNLTIPLLAGAFMTAVEGFI